MSPGRLIWKYWGNISHSFIEFFPYIFQLYLSRACFQLFIAPQAIIESTQFLQGTIRWIILQNFHSYLVQPAGNCKWGGQVNLSINPCFSLFRVITQTKNLISIYLSFLFYPWLVKFPVTQSLSNSKNEIDPTQNIFIYIYIYICKWKTKLG